MAGSAQPLDDIPLTPGPSPPGERGGQEYRNPLPHAFCAHRHCKGRRNADRIRQNTDVRRRRGDHGRGGNRPGPRRSEGRSGRPRQFDRDRVLQGLQEPRRGDGHRRHRLRPRHGDQHAVQRGIQGRPLASPRDSTTRPTPRTGWRKSLRRSSASSGRPSPGARGRGRPSSRSSTRRRKSRKTSKASATASRCGTATRSSPITSSANKCRIARGITTSASPMKSRRISPKWN